MGFYVGGKVGPIGYSKSLSGGGRSSGGDDGTGMFLGVVGCVLAGMAYGPFVLIRDGNLTGDIIGYTAYALYLLGIGVGVGRWSVGFTARFSEQRTARRLARAERKVRALRARAGRS